MANLAETQLSERIKRHLTTAKMAASSLIRQLLSYVYIVGLALARGRVINIFNGEKGDLAQYHRARRSITDGKFHNAIFNNSQNKWNLKDPNGYTVIPYVISGQYGVMHLMSVVKREGMYSCWKRTKTDREESQFDIIPSTKSTMYDIPYDYKSLMHYGKNEFAQPGKITMDLTFKLGIGLVRCMVMS
ncbi:hypothetical protein KIN20_018932 [Parelaphostrongylus tenuis]|uniref:Peptidase M12A domain-containing protein n=1 Tax=Parelaphostrongylus tenuis TaxID=148309 RepID=A0AAD5N2K0_PARTN|nr:hypothetical protein KIN20_018932 [Parelaphostrongylus tenuis]